MSYPMFAFDPHHTNALLPSSSHEHDEPGVSAPATTSVGDDPAEVLRNWAAVVAASQLHAGGGGAETVSPPSFDGVDFHTSARRSSAPYAFPATLNGAPRRQLDVDLSASRPASRTGKQKLAHSEVERERRKSIAHGFAQLQQTLYPDNEAHADADQQPKLMAKTVLLKQACSTIDDLRVRLEACTSIIASLNGGHIVEEEVKPKRVPSSSSLVSSASSHSSWPSSAMTMTQCTPTTTNTKKQQSAPASSRNSSTATSRIGSPLHSHSDSLALAKSSTSPDSLSLIVDTSAQQPPPLPSASSTVELRKAIAILLNCLSSSSSSSSSHSPSSSSSPSKHASSQQLKSSFSLHDPSSLLADMDVE